MVGAPQYNTANTLWDVSGIDLLKANVRVYLTNLAACDYEYDANSTIKNLHCGVR